MNSEKKPSSPFTINYWYFGSFFFILTLLSTSSILAKENLSGSRFFFFLYALGQVLLEMSLFIFLGWLIHRFLGRLSFYLFTGVTFFLFALHLCDFMMDRILDLSVWEALNSFIFHESWTNFLYLLDASGIPLWGWGVGFLILALIPLFGMYLYRTTEAMSLKKPLAFKGEWFLQAFFCLPAALFLWDFSASGVLHPDAYTAFLKSLPWKCTFLQPESVSLSLPYSLPQVKDEKQIAAAIADDQTVLSHRPNIYLFIIESFRADCIDAQTAPYLDQFRKENTSFPLTLSNANGTHLSWFSIFHSQFPYSWKRLQTKGWEMGSPPLALLKKWGYQVHVISSAQLNYYGMEQLLFGKKAHLIDSYKTFHHPPPQQAWQSDRDTLLEFQKQLQDNPALQEGQIFVFFWDSTHFDYSWPKSSPPRFHPFANELAYFKAFHTHRNIELIKNRYRNAVHYVDGLFGKFLEHLPHPEEAIVIVTGDHGEEFFENGHLFHGSHLNHIQTHVPIYFKFGNGQKQAAAQKVVCQMDIFPSVIDYLTGSFPSFLKGHSVFQSQTNPYAFLARFNAGLTPYEFCLHNGDYKLIAQFSNKKDIFQSAEIHIRSLRNHFDKSLPEGKYELEAWLQKEFGQALNHLFSDSAD